MTISLSFKVSKPKFRHPELLRHPTIPERLYGVNPRTIKGQKWWDEVRHKVYEENNFCCWACGRHKSKDNFHQWLEAHEWYSFDTDNCIVRLNQIVGLCHTCHSFIHIGNTLRRFRAGLLRIKEFRTILLHGAKTLASVDLPVNWTTYAVAAEVYPRRVVKKYGLLPAKDAPEEFAKYSLCSSRWVLVLEGKHYYNNIRGDLVEEEIPDGD